MNWISTLDFVGAAGAFLAIVLWLIVRRQRFPLEVRGVLLTLCGVTLLVNLSSGWHWIGHVSGADVGESLGDYLQILQPLLWGLFFYVVVQATQRRELSASHSRLRDIIEHMPVILHAYDERGTLLAWNGHAEAVTGFSKAEVLGRQESLTQLFPDDGYRQQLLDECRAHGASYQHRLRPLACKTGSRQRQVAWYSLSRQFPVSGWANWGIGLDMTDQLSAHKEMEHMAMHDELTGLPNRTLFRDRLNHALVDVQRNGNCGALLLLDLDHFKMVNDSHGHPVGDKLLCEVGVRLSACLKSTDTLARLGGDEFVILLERIGKPEEAALIAERILSTLTDTPFDLFGHEIRVRTSIGITVFPEDDVRVDELMKNVDLALYAAKKHGRNGYHFYSRTMHKKLRWQHRVAENLRSALELNEFSLHYQPQFSLNGRQVVGLEALLRWSGFEGESLSPAAFVPIAENMGLMPALGQWVVDNACRQAAQWQREFGSMPVAINLSSIQLFQPNLVETLARVVGALNLSPSAIEFEITESAVMRNMDSAIDTMRRLRDQGFRISLDDFGTGYSSLSYLKRFPISKIKVDHSFVKNIETDARDAAIVRSVVQLGHSLGMKVLAEGVETLGQLTRLADDGCDYIQGFYCGAPMNAVMVPAYLRQDTADALH